MPFDASTTFILNPGAGSVVMEVLQWGNTICNGNFTYPIDAARNDPNTGNLGTGLARIYRYTLARGTSVANGTYKGCPNAAGRNPTHQVASTNCLIVGGTKLKFTGNCYIGTPTPGVFNLGATPLNVPLPGTQCNLMNSFELLLVGVSQGSNGTTDFPLPLANDPALAGVKFYTQQWWVQAAANSLGAFSSRGLLNTIGNASPSPETYTSGSIGRNYGLVTQFWR